jgi:hypothetical protein
LLGKKAIAVADSERAEFVDGKIVFSQLQQKRQQRFGCDRRFQI